MATMRDLVRLPDAWLQSHYLADVAQLARASACHAEGRGFESLHPLIPPPPRDFCFRDCPGRRGELNPLDTQNSSAVELYWLPLGAGGRSVRLNGRVFEAVAAAIGRRPQKSLFHSGLIVALDGRRYAIEQTPVPARGPSFRGVVGGGSVGSNLLGRLRIFRYEIRCWPGGEIPDLAEAVDSPQILSTDAEVARRVVEAVGSAPTPVWGRDELKLGEMWNSNSVIAWSLERAGIDAQHVRLPAGGRAPGWDAGWQLARDRSV